MNVACQWERSQKCIFRNLNSVDRQGMKLSMQNCRMRGLFIVLAIENWAVKESGPASWCCRSCSMHAPEFLSALLGKSLKIKGFPLHFGL